MSFNFNKLTIKAQELLQNAIEIAQSYNSFYQSSPILNVENESIKSIRLVLTKSTAQIIKSGLHLLGIFAPERM